MNDHRRHDMPDLPPGLSEETARLLRGIAEGETEWDAASMERLEAQLEHRPEMRAVVGEWLTTLRLIEGQLREDGELVRAAESKPPSSQDLDLVRHILEQESTVPVVPPVSSARPARRSLGWFVAAGLLLGAFTLWRVASSPPQESNSDPIHLAPALAVHSPLGVSESFDSFSWEPLPLPPFGSYRLRIESASGASLLDVTTEDPAYTPTPQEQASLRAAEQIRWRVEAYDAERRRIAWGPFEEAWLSGS